jgi:hypothetical protein
MAPHKWRNRRPWPMPHTARIPQLHSFRGGTSSYLMDVRGFSMSVRENGQENNPVVVQQRAQIHFPSKVTTHWWAPRRHLRGNTRPFKMNGNNCSRVLQDQMRFLLALYRILFPKCTAAEINCFVYNNTPAGDK